MDTPSVPLKQCSRKERCVNPQGSLLPATDEYFRVEHSKGRSYFRSSCRVCDLEIARHYRENNREKVREASRRSKAKHADSVRAYRVATRDRFNAYRREWRKRDHVREHERAYGREYSKRYAARRKELRKNGKRREYERNYEQEHRVQIREQQRIRRASQPDKVRQWRENYKQKHPLGQRLYVHKRRALKMSLPYSFTDDDHERMMEWWHYSCAYCGAQRDFWHTLEADHFVALSSPDSPGTVPSNMIPACKSCNSRKFNRDPEEFVVSEFGGRKASRILARIAAYFDWVDGIS